ncbi:MAG: hypothetical protein DHS20C18_32000 [Saprospiraceae bacterium]|nr:MAG: hypothetical protein DHS20C18_32000 [Saprospiraceae bacterium]
MEITNGNDHLYVCKKLIEKKLGWGNSDAWENQDFLALSEKILEATDVQLSGTTLKRIWGKVKYQSAPHTNTLNTLVHFLGYENWLAFKAAHTVQQPKPSGSTKLPKQKRGSQKSVLVKTAALAGIVVMAIVIISFINRGASFELSPEDISNTVFTSNPVTSGIPNTVVFKYDVDHLNGTDFMIQQFWDETKRFNIDKNGHEATSIYYYPGYWRAKLLVDGQVIKEHDLHILSNGWMATIAFEPEPRYLLEDELLKKNKLTIAEQVQEDINASLEAPKWLTYHNVREFGGLDGDNFVYETAVKNTYEKGDGVCKQTRLILLGTKGAMIIPLATPGCISEINLMFNDFYESGKTNDLSAFGTDFSDWQKVRLEVQNKHVKILLNDQLIHELIYDESMGEIAGLRFQFRGSGEVKYVKLWNQKEALVFVEEFFDSLPN